MKIKKLSLIIISLILAVCMAMPLVACKDDNEAGGQPVKLDAPVIELDDETGVITWNEVAHATRYYIFEDGRQKASQAETSYTVTQMVEGSYEYFVVATSTDSNYKTSTFSNKVTYVVEGTGNDGNDGNHECKDVCNNCGKCLTDCDKTECAEKCKGHGGEDDGGNNGGQTNPVQLKTPELSLNEATGVITWGYVTGATDYEIYENDSRLSQTSDRSFTIPHVKPGKYVYKVRALSSDTESYTASEFSESVTYIIAVKNIQYTVSVSVPTSYTAAVQVAFCKGEQTVETKTVRITAGEGKVTFVGLNMNSYTVGFVSVANNYAGTSATVSVEKPTASLKIVAINASTSFKLGANSFTVANNDDAVGADMFYYFVAEESGTYTVDCSKETKSMYLSVNGTLYIDTANEAYYASFHAEAGALIEICVVGHVSGTFNFEIVKGEIKQYFRIGTEYGNRPNYVYGDCTRYLTVTTPGYYIFECSFATLSGKSLTLTVNGVDYFFGDGEDGEPVNLLQIPLNSGEHAFTVKVTGIDLDAPDVIPFVSFFIYPAD